MGARTSKRRRSLRILAKYRRSLGEPAVESNTKKSIGDDADAATICSNDSLNEMNNETEQLQSSDQLDWSLASTQLDSFGQPPSYIAEQSNDENDSKMLVTEDSEMAPEFLSIIEPTSPCCIDNDTVDCQAVEEELIARASSLPIENEDAESNGVLENNQNGSDLDVSMWRIDFLDIAPPSIQNLNDDEGEEEDIESHQPRRRQSRKQNKPKKRTDRVAKDDLKYQGTTKMLIPRKKFQSIVREVLQQLKTGFRLQSKALECLQESSEAYLVQLFEDANLACYHRSRVTLRVKDMRLVQLVRGPTFSSTYSESQVHTMTCNFS